MNKPRNGRRKRVPPYMPDEMVFAVCEKFVHRTGATQIANWLARQGFQCTREQVYPLLFEGIRRNYLRLSPPPEMVLAQGLARIYPQAAADISVLNVRGPTTLDHVAAAGADLAFSLVKELGRKKDCVHVGFGGGRTMMRLARSLGARLSSESDLPSLVLHALSSGFDVWNPTTAPVAFFSFFNEANVQVKCIGLFAEAVVRWEHYEDIKRLPGVRESFEAARDIDIVITSMGNQADRDSLLKKFMSMAPPKGQESLRRAGWVGDVMWRPYSGSGPITVNTGVRAVTIFELSDLVEMARTPGKHVILVAGPCGACGERKSAALRPLLAQPSLRVANHIVTDIVTATEVLEQS